MILRNRCFYHYFTSDLSFILFCDALKERLGSDLGPDAHTLIMRNHGAVTVGSSIGEAFVRMWYLEKACRTQITVMQSGGAICRPPANVLAHTAKQYDNLPNPPGYSEWNALVRWFIGRKFGVKVPPKSTNEDQAIPNTSVLDVQPIRACSNDLNGASYPVAIRGKKYLVGGVGAAGGALFPAFIPQGTADFPLTFKFPGSNNTPSDQSELICSVAAHIRKILDSELTACGALLFKKIPGVCSANDFGALITAMGYSTFDYSGE